MKNTMIVPVHSVIDVITNSSTEIFISADKSSVDTMRELIQKIMDSSEGGVKTVDDIFDIKYVIAPCPECDDWRPKDGDEDEDPCENCKDGKDSDRYVENEYPQNSLEVRFKGEGDTEDIMRTIFNMFEMEAIYR